VLGGEMIRTVTLEKTEYNVPPHRFEAGTPHVAGAIGLGAALDFVDAVGRETIAAYDAALLAHATEAVGECERRLEPAVFWRLRSHYP
jgi:cysteine desulfurase/selenocysteine lyase